MTFDIGLHEVCVRAGGRYAITKFSRMDSLLPNFVTNEAPLRALRVRESSAINFVLDALSLIDVMISSLVSFSTDPDLFKDSATTIIIIIIIIIIKIRTITKTVIIIIIVIIITPLLSYFEKIAHISVV